ncbi:MAG: hypothetical protein HQL05_04515 [Nitrospirae bacterium]|nr:hypothetical protein [Nitrospirota bacterium]
MKLGTNTITHKGFSGLVNVPSGSGTPTGELSALKSAINVDVGNAGNVVMRPGFLRVYEGNVHSLYSNGSICLFRQADRLMQLYHRGETDPPYPDTVAPYAVRTLATGIHGTLRMSYQYVAGRVYYSDTAITGVVELTARPIPVVRSWGMAPPDAPVISSSEQGILPRGNYQVTLTYTRNDGQESGASTVAAITLAKKAGASGGDKGCGIDLICPLSADPDVRKINIYVTAPNGEVPYLVASVDNTQGATLSQGTEPGAARPIEPGVADPSLTPTPGFTAPYHYRGETITGPPLLTWGLRPPPPGQLLCYYRGRLYVAGLNTLWYSQPYSYELFDTAQGWISFDAPITLLAAVEDGIFVGTADEVVFLKGTEPERFQAMQVSNCGAVFGTQAMGGLPDDNGVGNNSIEPGGAAPSVVFWQSRMGMCAGGSGGRIEFLTANRYSFEVGETGTGIFWQRDGMQLYLSIMQGCPLPPVDLHSSMMTTRDRDSGRYALAMPVAQLQSEIDT